MIFILTLKYNTEILLKHIILLKYKFFSQSNALMILLFY